METKEQTDQMTIAPDPTTAAPTLEAPVAAPPAPTPESPVAAPAGEAEPAAPENGSARETAEPKQPGTQNGRQGQQGGRSQSSGGKGDRSRRGRERGKPRERQERVEGPPIPCNGILDVLPDGFGFLRTNGYSG